MATRRHYIDHDDTKPRKKNEYYEVREYNVNENVMDKYWRESGKPTRYQQFSQPRNYQRSYRQRDNSIFFIIGGILLLIAVFMMKPPTGKITITNGNAVRSADQQSITITATVENTSGAVLYDLYCTAQLQDEEGIPFSYGKTEIAGFLFPGSKRDVTITLPTQGHTGTIKTWMEAKGTHFVWGMV